MPNYEALILAVFATLRFASRPAVRRSTDCRVSEASLPGQGGPDAAQNRSPSRVSRQLCMLGITFPRASSFDPKEPGLRVMAQLQPSPASPETAGIGGWVAVSGNRASRSKMTIAVATQVAVLTFRNPAWRPEAPGSPMKSRLPACSRRIRLLARCPAHGGRSRAQTTAW